MKRIKFELHIQSPVTIQLRGDSQDHKNNNLSCIKVGAFQTNGKSYHLLHPHPADQYPITEAGQVPTVWAREI